MMERYLTQAEKAKVLREFAAKRSLPSNPSHRGGTGDPDPDILPWCDKLNELDGVVTVQSCAGHPSRRNVGQYPGQLWLRLSKEMSAAFEARIGKLLAAPCIRQVTKMYAYDEGRTPHEVIDIAFHGNEDKGGLEAAMPIIIGYFESLNHAERRQHAAQATPTATTHERRQEPREEKPKGYSTSPEVVTGLLLKGQRAYMDWLLSSSGKRLGDARDADLEVEIAALKNATEMTEHAITWLSRIRMRLKPGKTVGQSMDEQELGALRETSKRRTA